MDMDSAAVFLAASILTMLGFIAIAMGVVAINNIFSHFWQPVKLFTPDSWKGFYPPVQEQSPTSNTGNTTVAMTDKVVTIKPSKKQEKDPPESA